MGTLWFVLYFYCNWQISAKKNNNTGVGGNGSHSSGSGTGREEINFCGSGTGEVWEFTPVSPSSLQQRFWHHCQKFKSTFYVCYTSRWPKATISFSFNFLPCFLFHFNFSLQGVLYLHQWKTLITPFWWEFRPSVAVVPCLTTIHTSSRHADYAPGKKEP